MTDDETLLSGQYECPICNKHYNIRSSFVRHSRQCLERVVSAPRKKSCLQCANAKVRCDKTRPICSRCALRGDCCEYLTKGDRQTLPQSTRDSLYPSSSDLSRVERENSRDIDSRSRQALVPTRSVNFSIEATDIPLTPNSNSESGSNQAKISDGERQQSDASESAALVEIHHRHTDTQPHESTTQGTELHGAVTNHEAHQIPAAQPALQSALSYLCRIFRTYTRMMSTREQLPPFIHEAQISNGVVPTPLANCFALSRMWESHDKGVSGQEFIDSTIRRELEKLFVEYRSYDDDNLVAAFQAAFIYAMILLFPVSGKSPSGMFDLATLRSLQDFAFYVSSGTLDLPEERSHKRPQWKEWVLVGCKRRTLGCLNLFQWMNAMLNNMSNFPCSEANVMPAPAGKVLWGASTQESWEVAYDRWLGRWAGLGIYTLDDLMKLRPGPDLDLRSEMWLEEADEFGLLLMSIVNGTNL